MSVMGGSAVANDADDYYEENQSYFDEETYYVTQWDYSAVVHENNTWDVTEHLVVQFNADDLHGIFLNKARVFCALGKYNDAIEPYYYHLNISNLNVSEDYITMTEDDDPQDNLIVRIGDEYSVVTGTKEYTISYTIEYPADRMSEKDFIFHSVMGADWQSDVLDFRFDVRFDKPLPESAVNSVKVYSGDWGNTEYQTDMSEYCHVTSEGFSGEIIGLSSHTAVTFYTELPDGFFNVDDSSSSMNYVLLAVLLLIVGWLLYKFFTSQVKFPVASVEFYPPDGISSAEAGTIIDESADVKDITSLIPWFAHRGHIQIKELGKDKDNDIELTMLKPLPADAPDYQRVFFNDVLFAKGDVVRMKELGDCHNEMKTTHTLLNDSFKGPKQLYRIKADITLGGIMVGVLLFFLTATNHYVNVFEGDTLLTSIIVTASYMVSLFLRTCYYASVRAFNKKANIFHTAVTVLLCILSLGTNYHLMAGPNTIIPFEIMSVIILLSFVVAYYSHRASEDTDYKLQMTGKLIGLREFIKTAEQDRLKMLVDDNPEYFYDILPYAMVFGLTKKWANQFQNIDFNRPSWYIGDALFMSYSGYGIANALAHSMNGAASSGIRLSSHNPEAQGWLESVLRGTISGSGGGGFSGGGGGGGGGGAWCLLVPILFLSSMTAVAQKTEVSAHVIDAKTNESLPYVNVFISVGNGTLTNADGDFTVTMADDDSVRFSYVGYQTLTLAAGAVSETVKLTPLSISLGEVTVLAQENILVSAAKVLEKDFRKHRNERSNYFYRMNTTYRNELMEAFVEASSAVNLRDLLFLKGRRGQATLYGLDETAIGNMNLHHMLELSPMTNDSKFWNRILTPFILPDIYGNYVRISNESLNYYYDMNSEKLTDDDGNQIYKIVLSSKTASSRGKTPGLERVHNGTRSRKINLMQIFRKPAILTGTLYIDAKTKHLLRFDGQVENMELEIIKDFYHQNSPITSKVKINFNHDSGFTEVSSIANTVSNGNVTINSLLYNVNDLDLGQRNTTKKESREKKKKIKKQSDDENVLATIDDAGFDALLWKRSNIVQRTAVEAQIAGMSEQMVLGDSVKKVDTSMEMLVDHLTRFGKNLPQEKIYLHMDNTNYFIGDTIWFAAYTRQTNDNTPSKISGVLYVELYNQDGYMVERKLIEMTNGRGYGNFIIDKENYAGYYELRAYTRWQLNWGLYEHFHSKESEKWFLTRDLMNNYLRDYHKLYSRVFPVYDAPKEEGDYTHTMTLRPMRQVFTHDPDKHEMVLTLFPEGGNLVEGLPCRVAYEAAWDNGQALEGKLGETMCELRGRGTFEVIPEKGTEREVVFTAKDGTKVKAKLPKAEKTGVALKVTQDYDSVYLKINTTADLADEAKGLTIMHEGVLEKFEPIAGDTLTMTIALTDLCEGVNQATVFDAHGHVWADRLFFVRNDETGKPNVSISGMKDSYEPYEKVSLHIKAPQGKGIMSFSVRDASHRDVLYDNASMLTEMLLSSEIKGFVENPEWFFEANDNAHNRALDLLMMTQGWRRFDWHEMAVRGAWELNQVAERTPVIEGQVYDIAEGEFERDLDAEYEIAKMKAEARQDDIDINMGVFDFLKRKPLTSDPQDTTADGDEDVNIVDAMGGYAFVDTKTNKEIFGIDRFEEEFETNTKNDRRKYSSRNHWQGNVDGIMYGIGSNTSNLAEVRYFPGEKNKAFKNKALLIHSKLESMDGKQNAVKEMPSADGHFKFQLPRYYGDYILHIAAADTLSHVRPSIWVQLLKESDLESHAPWEDFSVRVNWPYPRFVKPYNYYQTHLNYSYDPLLRQNLLADGSLQLDNVSVWGKHNALHAKVDSIPALIVDAYEAYNRALDDGFMNGRQEYIVRTFVGDYGLAKPYTVFNGYNIREYFGYNALRRALNGITTDRDSAYMRQNLKTFTPYDQHGYLVTNISKRELASYYLYNRIDKYVIYTDYQPRLEGSHRYAGSNLPQTCIATFPFPDDSQRYFYKSRRYIMQGFAYVNQFYNPDYSKREIDDKPKDYRRTLYWNPFLVLDNEGQADVHFWNNATQHKISIEAQGTSNKGEIMVGKEM